MLTRATIFDFSFVMAGLVPAIHIFLVVVTVKTWMPGTEPAQDGACGETFPNQNLALADTRNVRPAPGEMLLLPSAEAQ